MSKLIVSLKKCSFQAFAIGTKLGLKVAHASGYKREVGPHLTRWWGAESRKVARLLIAK